MVLKIQKISNVFETPMTLKRIIYGYLQLNYIIFVTKKNKYDIGHYKNASKIGFHFENGSTNKIWQSKLYKDKYYFPRSITTTSGDDIISSFFSKKPTKKRIIYKQATDFGKINRHFKNAEKHGNTQQFVLCFQIINLKIEKK